ncbi:hypothetical protein [Fibrivirga algicola]|uniref:Lipoprotein n=1 Tax=Fibrivirga algicola TaxID=2950420 RepID=A0ABX0QPW3_9BACT|nr:hypothetical protein [Fibrivirga algicola]NID13838.1 hypothetical protein [Fibrivirga algicola]
MKQLCALLSVLFLLSGCSKTTDVAPDLAAAIAGTYNATKEIDDYPGTKDDVTINLPTKTISATIVLTRKTEKTVSLTLNYKIAGQPDDLLEFGDFEVKANGGNYDISNIVANGLIAEGTTGTIINKTLTYKFQSGKTGTGAIYSTFIASK